jgi:hypothetical protein
MIQRTCLAVVATTALAAATAGAHAWLIASPVIVSPFALLAHAAKQDTVHTATTAAIDTTGANLIVIITADFRDTAPGVLTDSKSNVWTRALDEPSGANTFGSLYYCNPCTSVGAGHTFTFAGTSSAPSLAVAAFSGAKSSGALDQSSQTTTTGTSLNTAALVPTENKELVVLGLTDAWASTATITLATTTDVLPLVGGVSLAVAEAYQIQGAAHSTQPTWSWSGSARAEALGATFKSQ